MEKSKLVQALLVISGIIGVGIGSAILFAPVAFEASSGINLEGKVSLLSEIRAFGGLLASGGALILLGAFVSNLTHTSLVLSSLLYLSVGISRTLGIAVDGVPQDSLLYATFLELILGALSLMALIKSKKRSES